MDNFKKQYRDLEMQVLNKLRSKVIESPHESKYINGKAIEVSVFGYEELAIINDRLVFMDHQGLQYSLFSDASLEDLIDILN